MKSNGMESITSEWKGSTKVDHSSRMLRRSPIFLSRLFRTKFKICLVVGIFTIECLRRESNRIRIFKLLSQIREQSDFCAFFVSRSTGARRFSAPMMSDIARSSEKSAEFRARTGLLTSRYQHAERWNLRGRENLRNNRETHAVGEWLQRARRETRIASRNSDLSSRRLPEINRTREPWTFLTKHVDSFEFILKQTFAVNV